MDRALDMMDALSDDPLLDRLPRERAVLENRRALKTAFGLSS